MKPHNKLAALLLLTGKGMILIEGLGLGLLRQSGASVHLGQLLLSLLVLIPASLLLAGCAVFVLGAAQRR